MTSNLNYKFLSASLLLAVLLLSASCGGSEKSPAGAAASGDSLATVKAVQEIAALMKRDSLGKADYDRMVELLSAHPGTLEADFPNGDSKTPFVQESKDGRLRLYVLDNPYLFAYALQYVDDDGAVHVEKGPCREEGSAFLMEMTRLNEPVYVIGENEEMDPLQYATTFSRMRAFRIKEKGLAGVPLFDKGEGLVTDRVVMAEPSLTFNSGNMSFRAMVTDPAPPFGEKEIICSFDGRRFDFTDSLLYHPCHVSLSGAVVEKALFYTKDYIVKIDSMAEGDYRYASWKRPATLADKPHLTVSGFKNANTYTFENDGFVYKVRDEKYTGYKLIVEKEGKKVLEQSGQPKVDYR